MADQEKWRTKPPDADLTKTGCEAGRVAGDVADLLEWRRKLKGHKAVPSEAVRLRDRVRLFSRREKEAVVLGFLLSDGIRDEELDAVIEVLLGQA